MWMQNQELQEEEEKWFWNSGRILRCSNLCSKCQASQVFIGRLNKIVQLVLEKKINNLAQSSLERVDGRTFWFNYSFPPMR